ncbi:hypothetical protein J132_10300 [Termitomyces sp. J132]|nr:hypothetical protein H2248_003484 [Termitomyces sp. 'cryptogamus']KNZ76494.1 hypothetical protein J132_10300 [Termitomyces sp. J132]
MSVDIPSDILWRICNAAWVPHIFIPGDVYAESPRNEAVIKMSLASSRLRSFALALLFKEVYNWKRIAYKGGVWPSAVWPYIRTVNIFDRRYIPALSRIFNDRDLLDALPNLIATTQVKLRFTPDSPKGVSLPYLLAVSTLPALHTLKLQQRRFDDPKLIDVFVEMHQLSSLGLTLTELQDIPTVIDFRREVAWDQEIDVVSEILQFFSTTLVELEVSGDLIELQMIASTKWPKLATLCLVNHIPYDDYQYLPVVVSQMPSLHTLHCNFRAEMMLRHPLIFCSSAEVHPPLSAVLPDLTSLSLSNIQPRDKIVEQLPSNSKALHIVALRDHIVPDTSPYNYSGLTNADVIVWIDAAAKLPFLVRLSLGLKSAPSPTLLAHISRSCPGLEYLELEQDFFEYNENESSSLTLELFIVPLQNLLRLRELRMSVELGPSLEYLNPSGPASTPLAFVDRAQRTAMLFAEKLPKLEFIGFSCATQFILKFDRYCMWHMLEIIRQGGQIHIRVAESI